MPRRCSTRSGANYDTLNLEAIGLMPGERGKLDVDETFRTAVENVYAGGDVIGFPTLASTSMEQDPSPVATCSASPAS